MKCACCSAPERGERLFHVHRRAAGAQVVNSISNDSDMPDVRDSESAAQVMVNAITRRGAAPALRRVFRERR